MKFWYDRDAWNSSSGKNECWLMQIFQLAVSVWQKQKYLHPSTLKTE